MGRLHDSLYSLYTTKTVSHLIVISHHDTLIIFQDFNSIPFLISIMMRQIICAIRETELFMTITMNRFGLELTVVNRCQSRRYCESHVDKR